MKLSTLFAHCVLGLSAASAFAGGVTLTTVGGKTFAQNNGALIAQGAYIRVGTFDLPPATRDATLRATSDYAKLKAWFRPLGESIQGAGTPMQAGITGTKIRANGFPDQGDIFGTVANILTSYMAPGTQLYVWVFDSSTPETSNEWGIFTAAQWLAPQKLGVTALATAGSVDVIQGQEVAGQLRLNGPQATYGNWVMKKFASEVPPVEGLFSADPDGDGLCNLAEYAWHLDPQTQSASMANLTATSGSGGQPTFEFKAPKALPDVQVIAECSPDLRTWTPTTTVITSSDAEFDTHTASAPSGSTHLFWRVRFQSVTAP